MENPDGLSCYSEEEEVLKRLWISFANNLRRTELEMILYKTLIMNISRDEEEAIEIVFDSRIIQNVEQFKYSGSNFSNNRCVWEIGGRIVKHGRIERALYYIKKKIELWI